MFRDRLITRCSSPRVSTSRTPSRPRQMPNQPRRVVLSPRRTIASTTIRAGLAAVISEAFMADVWPSAPYSRSV